MKRAWVVALAAVFAISACSSSGGGNASQSQSQSGSQPSSSSGTATRPLRVMVTNDDGVGAPGMDAVVTALSRRPGVEVTVVAPADNQSGSGAKTTPGDLTADQAKTVSGYPAIAVHGFPADAVNYGLAKVMTTPPDLVISGANEGQNLGPFIDISGTVGAARAAAQHGVPALAVSAGNGHPDDYVTTVMAVMQWLDRFQPLLLASHPAPATVANLNVPGCLPGTIRGTVEVAADPNAPPAEALSPADCSSTAPAPTTDVAAYHEGYVTLSDLALQPAGG